MEWTTEAPTKSGYYWCKFNGIGEEAIAIVFYCGDGDYECGFEGIGTEMPLGLKEFKNAKWFGPIEPPSE